jgi:hypothetical protein
LKKFTFVGGAAGLGLAALLVTQAPTHAADHLDAPAASANPMADITDVYAWMDTGANNVNLIMDVSPGDPGGGARSFGPSILYVFHVTSFAAYGAALGATGTTTEVICKFDSDTSASCWVGTKGYVHGDPSTMVSSTDGKIKLFAGRRSDPFFFNFNGFKDAQAYVKANAGTIAAVGSADAAGCPTNAAVLAGAAGSARAYLSEAAQGSNGHAPCNGSQTTGATQDCFQLLDVHAIVLQVDKSLLNTGTNTILGVWASTNSAS